MTISSVGDDESAIADEPQTLNIAQHSRQLTSHRTPLVDSPIAARATKVRATAVRRQRAGSLHPSHVIHHLHPGDRLREGCGGRYVRRQQHLLSRGEVHTVQKVCLWRGRERARLERHVAISRAGGGGGGRRGGGREGKKEST